MILSYLTNFVPHVYLALDSSCSKGIFGPGTPGLYDNLCSGGSVAVNALSDILVLVSNVVRILLTLSGALALIFLIVGAIFYVVSAGDPGRLKQAKDILTNVAVGLIVILLAYAVVTFLAGGLF